MFRTLARMFLDPDLTNTAPNPPRSEAVFLVHPLQLSRWLDEAWAAARLVPPFGPPGSALPFLGDDKIVPALRMPVPVLGSTDPYVAPSGIDAASPPNVDRFTGVPRLATDTGVGLIWDHLIYAYLIESTGASEILTEVVRRYAVGETLDKLSPEGHEWLRSTEDLFLRDPPLFTIGSVSSHVRPDMREARRNVYWRMFGLDLPHPVPARWAGSATAEAWKLDTGSAVNTGFREKWTELLRQVWLGMENARNSSGANATDKEYVAFLALAIRDLLNMRRRGGQLAREEFVHVSTMSWFHLTLESDSPIVRDMKAEAVSPEERLAKIAQRVGMAPAPRARELFQLAERMSALLRAIELGLFDTGAQAEQLYLPVPPPPSPPDPWSQLLLEDMNRIIDLWQSATGERVKDRMTTTATQASAQPIRLPAPTATPVAAGQNGSAPRAGAPAR